jgi:uncharacterized protein (DUF1697 family)
MKTWIALLRGINVGGRNILPMAELRTDLEALGLDGVRTYIQSGNVVFRASDATAESLAETIAGAIEDRHGFSPSTFVLSHEQLAAAIDANPFPEGTAEPRTLHFYFLSAPAPEADLQALDAVRSENERYELTDEVFYLHAPDGIGRSKLAASVDRHLGVATTARNYRTVDRLLSMVREG